MLVRRLYMHLTGFVTIAIEGFFVERFMNMCFAQDIFLWNVKREKNTYVKVCISTKDFKKIKRIAKKNKCRVKIEKKTGVPFVIHNYRKRKIFFIFTILIFVLIFIMTRFIWNVDVIGNEKIDKNEILELLKEDGIESGTLKSKIKTDEIINEIRLQKEEIAWIGIKIKGTNAIVEIVETKEKPEIVDENEVCNIVAKESAIVSKIVVQNGTARVNVGDEVKQGDLLVEGIMEGKYTGIRQVHAEASIYGKISYEKSKKESLIQEIEKNTGNEEKKIEINLNNFKIILPKGVSKFKNYDTIKTNKKLKLFSNFYLPISITKINLIEKEKEYKNYGQEELIEKIKKELEEELKEEHSLQDKEIEELLETNVENGIVNVKVTFIVQEEIGTKENL